MNKDTGLMILAAIGFIVVAGFLLGVLGSVFFGLIKFIFPLILAIALGKLIVKYLEPKNSRRNY